jgi:putative transposase
VRRAYKLRAYPTRRQEARAVRLLADHCDLYNAALTERREAWRMHNLRVSYGDQSAQLKEIRAADPDGQGRHSFTAQQQTLRRLNTVFAAYFRRVGDVSGKDGGLATRGSSPISASTRCYSWPGTAPGGSPSAVAGGGMRNSRRSVSSRRTSIGRFWVGSRRCS